MLTEVVWSTMCNMKIWEATLNVVGKGLLTTCLGQS